MPVKSSASIPRRTTRSSLLNRAIADGGAVQYDDNGARGGRYLVSGITRRESRRLGERTLVARRAESRGGRRRIRRSGSRIAVYKPWTASMDEGWIEWLLDQYQFKYTDRHERRHSGRRSRVAVRRRAHRVGSSALDHGRLRQGHRPAAVRRRNRRRRRALARYVRSKRRHDRLPQLEFRFRDRRTAPAGEERRQPASRERIISRADRFSRSSPIPRIR